ncbi:hypothetical protein H9Q13_00920 [Pontibacter sp. JH31]|uniref:Uncharacterized protein n=1 Tax=Pontibacter aquaedesilientis TaxID=2766980 RepID=A0ABR7XDN3_9BACT|nr:hypothetical protein [Pontibacter aquaedesilientis]MBD1395713.1 hypothetical protein [Pontibacter aquaedesilientis]
MAIFWTFLIAAILGYIVGHYIVPNRQLRQALQDVRKQCATALEEGNKGVYKTIVSDNGKSSELVVEVRELAVTKTGQVKVEYLSAQYRNPDFRTKKGEALLLEVRDLLGEYLPLNDIEWYETTDRHENIKKYLNSLDLINHNLFR